MVNLKKNELNEVINSTENVLILFSAEWCGPCKVLKPNLEKIEETKPEYKFVKIDVSEDEESTDKFKIRNIPTVILIKNKKEIARFLGARPIEHIEKFFEEYAN